MNEHLFKQEYIAHNGKHFNEALAKLVVADMWHEDSSGKKVVGEAVAPQDALKLLAEMDANKQEKLRWDAYVAANAFAHDLASASIPTDMVMRAAKAFWFHDDDIDEGCHKVFWYFFK